MPNAAETVEAPYTAAERLTFLPQPARRAGAGLSTSVARAHRRQTADTSPGAHPHDGSGAEEEAGHQGVRQDPFWGQAESTPYCRRSEAWPRITSCMVDMPTQVTTTRVGQ